MSSRWMKPGEGGIELQAYTAQLEARRSNLSQTIKWPTYCVNPICVRWVNIPLNHYYPRTVLNVFWTL